jgi:hypothetical protein
MDQRSAQLAQEARLFSFVLGSADSCGRTQRSTQGWGGQHQSGADAVGPR